MDKKVLIPVIAVIVLIGGLPLLSRMMPATPSAPSPNSSPGAPSPTAASPATPTAAAPAAVSSSAASRIATEFVAGLVRGEFWAVTAKFDETMKVGLPPSKLAETWNVIQAQMGYFRQQLSVRTEEIQGQVAVFVTCQFDRGVLDLQVAVNPASQISGFYATPKK